MILPFQIPPSGIIQVRNGDKKFKLATNQTSYLTQRLFWQGPSDFEYTNIFSGLIKKVSSFFDVGSNIGYYTIFACSENSNLHLISFEPAKSTLLYLKKNVLLNNFGGQIKIEEIALTDVKRPLTFHEVDNKKYKYTHHSLSGKSNASTRKLDKNFKIYTVPGTSLDTYCEKNAESAVDLIKIDAEGAELAILKGGYRTISNHHPIIICEIHFDIDKKTIESILKELGYEFYLVREDKLVKIDRLTQKGGDGVRNYFMVHPDKYPLIEEFIDR